MRRRSLLAAALAAPGGYARLAQAGENWPVRPLRLIVPTPPGGSADAVARVVADRLGDVLPQRVLVENKPGASGAIGIEQAARAAPDGYTFVLATSTSLNILPHLRSVPYDPFADLAPVAQICAYLSIVACAPGLGVSTLAELMALAQRQPGRLNYGTNGAGSFGHLAAETLKHTYGVNIVHVPYKGTADLVNALTSGDIQMVVDPIVLPQVKASKVRAIAIYAPFRHPELPDVPSITEAGLRQEVFPATSGIMAPIGTPPDILATLSHQAALFLAEPRTREMLGKMGVIPAYLDGADYLKQLRAASDANARIIVEAKITID